MQPCPKHNFSWVPNCSLRPQDVKQGCPKKPVWDMWKMHLRMGNDYKITHISAVAYHRLLTK